MPLDSNNHIYQIIKLFTDISRYYIAVRHLYLIEDDWLDILNFFNDIAILLELIFLLYIQLIISSSIQYLTIYLLRVYLYVALNAILFNYPDLRKLV